MTRDSFVFYRSFFEAVSCMPPKVQAEVYPAIVDYALNGKEPAQLSAIAKGVFILVKPLIDTNAAKAKGGQKGAAYGKLGGRPKKQAAGTAKSTPAPVKSCAPPPSAGTTATATLSEEIDQMKADRTWNEPVCMQFHLTAGELAKRLDGFLNHCKCENDARPHKNINDAKRHFCSWMRKAYPLAKKDGAAMPEKPSYDFDGGFGGQDI